MRRASEVAHVDEPADQIAQSLQAETGGREEWPSRLNNKGQVQAAAGHEHDADLIVLSASPWAGSENPPLNVSYYIRCMVIVRR